MSPEVHNRRNYGLPATLFLHVDSLGLMSLEICFREANCRFKLVAFAYRNKRRLPIKKTWSKEDKQLIQKGLNVDPSKRPNTIDIHKELNFFTMCKNNAVIAIEQYSFELSYNYPHRYFVCPRNRQHFLYTQQACQARWRNYHLTHLELSQRLCLGEDEDEDEDEIKKQYAAIFRVENDEATTLGRSKVPDRVLQEVGLR